MTPNEDGLILSKCSELFDLESGPLKSAMGFGIRFDGSGWLGLLDRLCDKLQPLALGVRAQGMEFKILGVKRKFGTLRIAYRGGNEAIAEEIERAKSEALRTCELCGEPGELRSHQNYLTILCGSCHMKYPEPASD